MKKFISCLLVIVFVAVGGFTVYQVVNSIDLTEKLNFSYLFDFFDLPQGEFPFFSKKQNNELKIKIKSRLDNSNIHSFYHSLNEEDKDIYAEICAAIESFDYNIELGRFDTPEEAEKMNDRVADIYYSLLYEQPQYFWVDPFFFNYYLLEERGNRLTFSISPLIDNEEAMIKIDELNEEVEKIVSVAKTKESTYDKALYVYDEILKKAEYDYELCEKLDELEAESSDEDSTESSTDISQTAYGCLVEGKTLCSGYTYAFSLIMQKLGYECGAVENKSTNSTLPTEATDHVSNYCKLDGEYYYFDLTWDDTEYDLDEYKDYFDFSHQYFAITSTEFEETHVIDESEFAPIASATQYNYFNRNNMYFEKYDYSTVKKSILNQMENNRYVSLKFSNSKERAKAEKDLIDRQKIFYIVDEDECEYLIPDSEIYLYVFFD